MYFQVWKLTCRKVQTWKSSKNIGQNHVGFGFSLLAGGKYLFYLPKKNKSPDFLFKKVSWNVTEFVDSTNYSKTIHPPKNNSLQIIFGGSSIHIPHLQGRYIYLSPSLPFPSLLPAQMSQRTALPALVGTNDPTEVAHADSSSEEDLGRWFGCIPESPCFLGGKKVICFRFSGFFCWRP